jgi:hypothetical protein
MNLSPEWVPVLLEHGFDGVHWSSLGVASASDSEIMGYAFQHRFMVFTHDLDFGAVELRNCVRDVRVALHLDRKHSRFTHEGIHLGLAGQFTHDEFLPRNDSPGISQPDGSGGKSVLGDLIKESDEYEGVRIVAADMLGLARIYLHFDICQVVNSDSNISGEL